MVMYDNEFKTKEEQKLTEIKKINCNISMPMSYQKVSLNWLATFYHTHNVKPFIEPFLTTSNNSEG